MSHPNAEGKLRLSTETRSKQQSAQRNVGVNQSGGMHRSGMSERCEGGMGGLGLPHVAKRATLDVADASVKRRGKELGASYERSE